MKKILLIMLISIVLLSSLTIAVIKPYILDKFDANKLAVLEKKGIGKFEVYNETCIQWEQIEIITYDEYGEQNGSYFINGECVQEDGQIIGYNQPMVSNCEYYDENHCTFSVYQKAGIHRQVKLKSRYCLTYNQIISDGSCLAWDENDNCTQYEQIAEPDYTDCIQWHIKTTEELDEEIEYWIENDLERIIAVTEKRMEAEQQ